MQEINIWFSIFIPLIGILITHHFFKKQFEWGEYWLGTIISALFIFIFVSVIKMNLNSDKEYWGSVGSYAKYTEYYETYVHQTCTRTYECGCTTDANGNESCSTCTETYDCSYCDENPAHWELYDNIGGVYNISKEEYNRLKKLWSNEKFIELNRDINEYWGCGKDGNAYVTNYDNNNCAASLYQQITDWFREKHKIHIDIVFHSKKEYGYVICDEKETGFITGKSDILKTYYKALNKAIEEAFKLI